MKPVRTRLIVAVALAVTVAGVHATRQAGTAATPQRTSSGAITFTVSLAQAARHLASIEMRVRNGALPAHTDLVMPVWTPGSYHVWDFSRGVQNFAASDADGHALAWRKLSKNTWQVDTAGAIELVVTYLVYANEPSSQTAEVTDRRAFWNNAAFLMYPAGRLESASELRVNAPETWEVATSLAAVPGARHVYRADNFDTLYDSPVLAGTFKTVAFDVRGVPHRIVLDGVGNYDAEQLRTDITKVVDGTISLMGDVPYANYTFLINLSAQTGGEGLEHMGSTAIYYDRFGFRPEASERTFIGLAAHEYFHLWNVKRIRPDALGPFDYTKENYTRLLWVAEGITSYYGGSGNFAGSLILRRAGLVPASDYLLAVAGEMANIQNTPGRLITSVEEASFDAWIKPVTSADDGNGPNDRISYYRKGGMLGLLLDLEIRRRSGDRRSLDDVMRHLYAEFSKKQRNYSPEDFQRACELMAGSPLENFFTRYVRGRDELDYAAAFAHVGLNVEETTDPSFGGMGLSYVDPGADRSLVRDDRLRVRSVNAGSPAQEQGLSPGDEIVAIGGLRVTYSTVWNRFDGAKPGDIVQLTIFRGDELRVVDFKFGPAVFRSYQIVPVESPTAAQAAAYEKWLGAPFPRK